MNNYQISYSASPALPRRGKYYGLFLALQTSPQEITVTAHATALLLRRNLVACLSRWLGENEKIQSRVVENTLYLQVVPGQRRTKKPSN